MKRMLAILAMLCVAPIAARSREPRLAGADSRGDAGQNAAQAAAQPKEIHVDPKILAGYVGRYQVTPTVILTVRLNGDHLFAFATGQQLAEMYASSEKDFFLDAVDTKFTFVTDSQGKATELIVHLSGQDQYAPRVNEAK